MISTPVASAQKIPTLSYADRAKKAQNLKSPIASNPARIVSTQPASNSNGTSTFPGLPPNSSSKSTSESTTNDSHPHLAAQSSSTDPTDVKPGNEDKQANSDFEAKPPPVTASQAKSPQKLPVVNVWNVRKEQMAAARSALPHNVSLVQNTLPSNSSIPQESNSSSSKSSSTSVPKSRHGPSATTAINGVSPPTTSADDDLFLVRPSVQPTKSAFLPPSVDDAESWPEVGRAATSTTATTSAIVESNTEAKADVDNVRAQQEHQGHLQRKSEKTKWVPIPPEELQAAADSFKHQSHSRKGSQYTHVHSRSGNHSNQSSASQTESRIPSAAQSNSHSTVQSRSESLQSSPRFPRGKRLPSDDIVEPVGSVSHSNNNHVNRSSRAASPSLKGQPQLRPPYQPTADSSANFVLPSMAHPAPIYGQAQNSYIPYYVPGHSSGSHNPSQHMQAQRTSYHSSQSSTPPLPQPAFPSAGTPPYPLYHHYNPYDYPGTASPYPYWNGHSHSGSGQHSPVYVPPTGGSHFLPQWPSTYQPPQQHSRQPHRARKSELTSEESYISIGGVGKYRSGRTGSKEKPVMFGSIQVSNAPQSGEGSAVDQEKQGDEAKATAADEAEDKPFSGFFIGIVPGDVGPSRIRSRTTSAKARSRTVTSSAHEVTPVSKTEADGASGEVRVIDLTNSVDVETNGKRWEFGTATARGRTSPPLMLDETQVGEAALSQTMDGVNPVPQSLTMPERPRSPATLSNGSPTYELQLRLQQLQVGSSVSPAEGGEATFSLSNDRDNDDFKVKDFGYGFGKRLTPPIPGQDGDDKEQTESTGSHGRQRKSSEGRERERFRETESPVRQRRGGYGGGYGYDREGRYGGRRGRNSYGRGLTRRGGFQLPPQPPRQAPFTLTPPPPFQPLVPVPSDMANGYFPPVHPPPSIYMPPGYDPYSTGPNPSMPHLNPPLPIPVSPISFPLDPTRWYLLGQLEYYLSPQNMVQDFFLRRRMDSEGWISIPLLASFNRVRHLTTDLQVVKDVLDLSSVVEVKHDYVRMLNWSQFVLPDAPPSETETQIKAYGYLSVDQDATESSFAVPEFRKNDDRPPLQKKDAGWAEDAEDAEADDEDEEDVVFVMDNETSRSGSWLPERHA